MCVYSSGSQHITAKMYIMTFAWKVLLLCLFDVFLCHALLIPLFLLKHLLFQSIKKKVDHMQMGPVSATRRERKYSSCSISIENHLGTWLVAVGYENTSCALAHTPREVHINIFYTLFRKKYKPDAGNMILIYSLTCHADNRCIWIWK